MFVQHGLHKVHLPPGRQSNYTHPRQLGVVKTYIHTQATETNRFVSGNAVDKDKRFEHVDHLSNRTKERNFKAEPIAPSAFFLK